MKKKSIVVFSGAGMSAESGLSTFRDSGGLWEKYRIEDVATPEAWVSNREVVIEFYNMRFKQLSEVEPNKAHRLIAEMESEFDISVITQNVDNLHERAGSTNVLHLHGELAKCKSEGNPNYIIDMPDNGLEIGMNCPEGYQLRPNVVWFGEEVPNMIPAAEIISKCDALIVVGTSLNVYPAAGLAYSAPDKGLTVLVDPGEFDAYILENIEHIKKPATMGIEQAFEKVKAFL
jgi:NAD-dependent deacetylase